MKKIILLILLLLITGFCFPNSKDSSALEIIPAQGKFLVVSKQKQFSVEGQYYVIRRNIVDAIDSIDPLIPKSWYLKLYLQPDHVFDLRQGIAKITAIKSKFYLERQVETPINQILYDPSTKKMYYWNFMEIAGENFVFAWWFLIVMVASTCLLTLYFLKRDKPWYDWIILILFAIVLISSGYQMWADEYFRIGASPKIGLTLVVFVIIFIFLMCCFRSLGERIKSRRRSNLDYLTFSSGCGALIAVCSLFGYLSRSALAALYGLLLAIIIFLIIFLSIRISDRWKKRYS